MTKDSNNFDKIIKQAEDQKKIYEYFIKYMQLFEKSDRQEDTIELPKNLIMLYYQIMSNVRFDYLKKAFIKRYIENESQLETAHLNWEKKGLKKMYNYIHSCDTDKIDIYTLLELHKQLFSFAPSEDFGGHFRNIDVYLPESGTNLMDWSYIRYKIVELKPYVKDLVVRGKQLNGTKDFDALFKYIDECIILNSDLIRIHPFYDGNGRCVRGFTNILFELANIPPVYILESEKKQYRKALKKSDVGDYDDILKFYYYKICDSIFELTDIEKENNELIIKKLENNDNNIQAEDSDIKIYSFIRDRKKEEN